MKLFKCQNCELLLFFENRLCTRCGYTLGFLPEEGELSALTPENGSWRALAAPGALFKSCGNAGYDTCNWLLPADSPEPFCAACRHNRTVPDLNDFNNLEQWRKLEFAKHRLFYSLLKLRLPLPNRIDDPDGLAFDFLADSPDGTVLTGHDNGLITLSLKEADDAEREARRTAMHEPYRTLLGHFRHEIGHYYWDKLVENTPSLEPCRALFGDDRIDYDEALKRHYDQGAPAGWQQHFVSSYATCHPWEDFAETWAHYMHIVDGVETSCAYNIEAHPALSSEKEMHTNGAVDPYSAGNIRQIIDRWLPLTYAMNAMNRSMGLGDIYPFVLSPSVIEKLGFMHRLVQGAKQPASAAA